MMPTTSSSVPFGVYAVVQGEGKVTSSPAGIACGKACNAVFAHGTQVKLKAKPKAGFRFVGWSGACSGSKATCKVTVDDVTAVVAKFKPAP